MPIVRRAVTIAAPPQAVWDVLVDVPRQPAWMTDLKSVTMDEPGPVRVGSRGVGVIRMFGISQSDPIEVTEVDPPHRFGLRHLGRFAGSAAFRLAPIGNGSSTRVHWTEDLAFDPSTVHLPGRLDRVPRLTGLVRAVLGTGATLADPLMAPVFHHVFRADLRRLRALVEKGWRNHGTEDDGPTSGTP